MSKNKPKKMDRAIIVALIGLAGTTLAALIASPLFERLFPGTPQVEPAGEPGAVSDRVFWENFESGYASVLSFTSEEWQVMEYGGGSVLEVSGTSDGNTSVSFGPNDFSDGVIEFKLLFINFDGFLLIFRSNGNMETYTLYLSPISGEVKLGYGSAANNWELEPFEDGLRTMDFAENVWYAIKLETSGSQFTLWMDDKKILSVQDSMLKKGGMGFAVQYDGTVLLDDIAVYQSNP